MGAVRVRGESDHLMSSAWALVPFFGLLVFFVISILLMAKAPNLIMMVAMMLVGYAVYAACMVYVFYHLIKRRNAHFRRDAALRGGIIQYLKERVGVKKESLVTSEIATMNLVHSESLGEEREKSAVVWTILSFVIPLVGIYVLYFLTKDPPKHDQRQLIFMQQVQSAASKIGLTLVVPSWKALPGRSFALYFIITLLVGLFIVYWYYVLIKDFNDHFKAQWQFEDQLISAVS